MLHLLLVQKRKSKILSNTEQILEAVVPLIFQLTLCLLYTNGKLEIVVTNVFLRHFDVKRSITILLA